MCPEWSRKLRRLQIILSGDRTKFPGLSLGIWSAYLLWSTPRTLESMDPYWDFDCKQLVSFKSGEFSKRNDNASQGYLGNWNSHICGASDLGSTTGKNTFESFTFIISSLLDQLGRLFWGRSCMYACHVPSRHTIDVLTVLAGRPTWDFQPERKVKWILQRLNW